MTIKDSAADINNFSSTIVFKDIEELENNQELEKTLKFGANRMSIFDMFFIGLLVLQVLAIALLLFNKKSVLLLEGIIAISLILFLYSFFYAKNANMDYFQRFVASKGQVTMAADTLTENNNIRFQLLLFHRPHPAGSSK